MRKVECPLFLADPVAGYTGSTISFASSIKAAREDWGEWLEAFERFLGKLKALSARVTFDEAEAGRAVTYTYVVTERTPQLCHMRRCRQTEDPEEDETELIAQSAMPSPWMIGLAVVTVGTGFLISCTQHGWPLSPQSI